MKTCRVEGSAREPKVSVHCILSSSMQAKERMKEESWSYFADELRVLADKALPDVEDKAKEILTIVVSPEVV